MKKNDFLHKILSLISKKFFSVYNYLGRNNNWQKNGLNRPQEISKEKDELFFLSPPLLQHI